MADTLCGSQITKHHIETILQKSLGTKAELVEIDGRIISKGLGFLSDVMIVNLKWTVQNGFPSKIIVKAPTLKNCEEFVKQLDIPELDDGFIKAVHEVECKAYNILCKANIIPIPKIYGCWPISDANPGVIVMEDLSERAGIISNIAVGLNLNQWKNIMAILADAHAWSMTTKVPWRDEIPGFETVIESFRSADANSLNVLLKAKESYPDYFSDIDAEAIAKEISTDEMLRKHREFGDVMEEVLQHGDTWVNNIMFVKNSDGSLTDEVAAIIDWQICVKGSCVTDMARLDSWSVNHELRRTHYMEVLRFYYDRLKQKAGDKVTISFEDLVKLYQKAFALNGFLSVVMIEVMLTAIAKVDEDETGWRKKEMLERARAGYDDAMKFSGL